MTTPTLKRDPWSWIPTLYFAEGLPYVAVMTIAVIMYKRLGLSNCLLYTSSNQVYMVVFNPPYSGQLTVKTPKGITITTAKTLTGEQTQVTETTRNEYNVSLPKNMPQEPFVIRCV